MDSRIIDVAKKAGVSHTTVSRILNNAKGYSFLEKTRQKVKLAAKEMNYTPNIAARVMQGKNPNSKMIGLVTQPNTTFAARRQIAECSSLIREKGYTPVLLDLHDAGDGWQRLNYFAGIICFFGSQEERVVELSERFDINIPIITLKAKLTKNKNVVSIAPEFAKGKKLALQHLVNCGHKVIAYVGHTQNADWFQDFCKANKLEGHCFFRDALHSYNSYLLSESIGKDIVAAGNITGILCEDDEFAMGMISYLFDNGIKVPEDCSVIGFDDLPFAAVARPKISSVRISGTKHTEMVVSQLISMIENKEVKKYSAEQNAKLKCELVLRESTCPYKREKKI
jgi:DNA-binding LacI/PurR family transcriptional regulator